MSRKKTTKASKTKDLPLKSNGASAVRGGRARGDKPVKYMEFKLKEVLISG